MQRKYELIFDSIREIHPEHFEHTYYLIPDIGEVRITGTEQTTDGKFWLRLENVTYDDNQYSLRYFVVEAEEFYRYAKKQQNPNF